MLNDWNYVSFRTSVNKVKYYIKHIIAAAVLNLNWKKEMPDWTQNHSVKAVQLKKCVCLCQSVGRVHPLRLSAGGSVRQICHHGLFLHVHWPSQDRGPVRTGWFWREEEEEKFGDDLQVFRGDQQPEREWRQSDQDVANCLESMSHFHIHTLLGSIIHWGAFNIKFLVILSMQSAMLDM